MDPRFEEGWFTDPFGRHEARWMSDGTPTALVRDGEIEGHDPPPDGPPPFQAEPLDETDERTGAEELRRSDDGLDVPGSAAGQVVDAGTADLASLELDEH